MPTPINVAKVDSGGTPSRDVQNDGPGRRQADVFVAQLEAVATQLTHQVEALEGAAAMPQARQRRRLLEDAKLRRLELYEARHYIAALQKRWGLQGPDPLDKSGSTH